MLEEIYEDGSLKLWLASFGEMFFSPEVSEEISEFVRGKMRARLKGSVPSPDRPGNCADTVVRYTTPVAAGVRS